MVQDICHDKLFLKCPKQHLKNQTSCGCLLSDFIPLAEKCCLNIRIVAKIELIREHDPIHLCRVSRFVKKFWDKISAFFLLSLDTQIRWKKYIVTKTLEGIIWWHSHRNSIALGVMLILFVFLLCKSLLVLFLYSVVALLVYIPVMQVKKDMDLYYVIETQHIRDSFQDINSEKNSSSITVINEESKYSMLLAYLKNTFPKTDCSCLNKYEKDCLDRIVNYVNDPEGEIKVVEVLIKHTYGFEYESYVKFPWVK